MHEFSKQIAAAIKSHYGNIECVDGENLCELEKWSAVIKNFTEFDKNVKIIEAMEKEEKDSEMMERLGYTAPMPIMDDVPVMGYNNRRYANGRYAPSGRGMRYGYNPYMHYNDDRMWYDEDPSMRMGYHGPVSGYPSGGQSSDKGRSYENYRTARRHYSENHTQEAKDAMDRKISEVFDDMESMTTEMVHDMDPAAKEKYKRRLQEVMNKIQ